MNRRRAQAVAVGSLALVASTLLAVDAPTSASGSAVPEVFTDRATLPAGFRDTDVIGGLSEPVSVAFAPDGTAFVALKTGGIKSYDLNAGGGQFEPAATSTDFAHPSVEGDN